MRPRDPDQALEPGEIGSAILTHAPELAELADIETRVLCNVDSSDISPTHWLGLGREIHETLLDDRYAGVVVTHGTDTMAYSAAALSYLLRGLKARNGVRVLGAPQVALVSFVVEGVHNADLAHLLTEQGIAVRAGHHCAMPLLKAMHLSGAIRVSLALYNDSDDLERFFEALDQALDMLR